MANTPTSCTSGVGIAVMMPMVQMLLSHGSHRSSTLTQCHTARRSMRLPTAIQHSQWTDVTHQWLHPAAGAARRSSAEAPEGLAGCGPPKLTACRHHNTPAGVITTGSIHHQATLTTRVQHRFHITSTDECLHVLNKLSQSRVKAPLDADLSCIKQHHTAATPRTVTNRHLQHLHWSAQPLAQGRKTGICQATRVSCAAPCGACSTTCSPQVTRQTTALSMPPLACSSQVLQRCTCRSKVAPFWENPVATGLHC